MHKVVHTMKLRPVLLVILMLSAFYYVTTHVGTTSASAPWLHHAAPRRPTPAPIATDSPSPGRSEPSNSPRPHAAPAYDSEEQQNIAVYKKALPSRRKHHLHRCRVRLLLWPRSAAGPGLRLHPQQSRATSSPTTTSSTTPNRRGQALRQAQLQGHSSRRRQETRPGAAADQAPNLQPATLSESQRPGRRPARLRHRQSLWPVTAP